MKRREFVERLGLGSAVLLSGTSLVHGEGETGPAERQEGHHHEQIDGPLAGATVSFGQWKSDNTNRFPNLSPRDKNQHLQIPYMPTIRAGGSVSFIIAGFHHLAVYEPGTKTTDIDVTLTQAVTMPPPTPPGVSFPLLINDPNGRVYRGLDPSLFPQDRVEVVTFANPGRYLVICAFIPHFVNDNMHGWVKVVRRGRGDDR